MRFFSGESICGVNNWDEGTISIGASFIIFLNFSLFHLVEDLLRWSCQVGGTVAINYVSVEDGEVGLFVKSVGANVAF